MARRTEGCSGDDKPDEPKLRHEFVGMMFAIAVGEVGLQAAGLVQSKHLIGYLPAAFHLVLATIVIAASWVGWSRSLARQDVKELFEWPFVVLLLDVAMVVIYFILVKTVDFSDDHHRIDPAYAVARWHVLIFLLYLLWDVVTKFVMPRPDRQTKQEWEASRLRIIPTAICLVLSCFVWRAFWDADYEHWLTADIALLSIVLLFRALKELFSAKSRSVFRWSCTLACVLGFIVGTLMTYYKWPLPLSASVIQEMQRYDVTKESAAVAPEPPKIGPVKR